MKDAVDLLNDQLTAALNENRRLRAAIERMSGCDGCDCEWQGAELVHRPMCPRWEP